MTTTGDDAFRAMMARVRSETGDTIKAVAERTLVHHNTIPRYIKIPESVPVYWFRRFVEAYDIRDAEIIAFVRGASEGEE